MTGVQFEIRIDGTPRTYRDRKDFATEAAARLIKSKNPHSMVEVKDLKSGDVTVIRRDERCPSSSAQPASAPGSTRTARATPSRRRVPHDVCDG
jgi:hypothetical protein